MKPHTDWITQPTISRQVVRTLLAAALGTFALVFALVYAAITLRSLREADHLLRTSAEKILGEIEIPDELLTSDCKHIANLLSLSPAPSAEELAQTARILAKEKARTYDRIGDSPEFSVVNGEGEILASSSPKLAGWNLNDAPEAQAFFRNLKEAEGAYAHDSFIPCFSDSSVRELYSGKEIEYGFYVVAGTPWQDYLSFLTAFEDLDGVRVGETGLAFLCGQERNILTATEEQYMNTVMEGPVFPFDIREKEPLSLFRTRVDGVSSYGMTLWTRYRACCVVCTIPAGEVFAERNDVVAATLLQVAVILGIMFLLLLVLMKRTVVAGVTRIAGSLARITDGNLDERVDVRTAREFASLSDGINSTVDTLKQLIAAEAARIDAELAYAKEIQLSALPRTFPPFPERTEFDLYARMDTAKEVGGDFYDFYLLDGDRVAFLVADVSGKGIPAALFMMQAKTMLHNLAEEGHAVHEVFTLANERLCANNEAGMFVTAWMCILNYKTGEAEFANAGHNFPVLRHRDGSFEFLKSRPGFVLAGMEGIRYRKNTLTFQPGDEIYLYTDGVTEATDAAETLYGDDRLLHILNTADYGDAEELCGKVKADVDSFVGDAPQFDDITMLCLRFQVRNA